MQIISLENIKDIDLSAKVFVYPTETTYGLGGVWDDQNVIEKIYQIKERDENKKLPIIADSFETVLKYFELNPQEKELAAKYWPGALTMVLKKKGSDEKVAVRVSENETAQKLASLCGGLIISTSANISGNKACLSVKEATKEFENSQFQPDFIVDGGKLQPNQPSTIIDVKNGKIEILRQGKVKIC